MGLATLRRAAAVLVLLGLPAVACAEAGAALYATHCVACHQAEGEGTPGIAPPLAGTLAKRAASDEGRAFLAQVLVSGMTGTIVAQGQRYNGNMPSFAALPDADLAGVMNHVLTAFNASSVALAPGDFAAARGRGVAPIEVRKLRERVLARTGE